MFQNKIDQNGNISDEEIDPHFGTKRENLYPTYDNSAYNLDQKDHLDGNISDEEIDPHFGKTHGNVKPTATNLPESPLNEEYYGGNVSDEETRLHFGERCVVNNPRHFNSPTKSENGKSIENDEEDGEYNTSEFGPFIDELFESWPIPEPSTSSQKTQPKEKLEKKPAVQPSKNTKNETVVELEEDSEDVESEDYIDQDFFESDSSESESESKIEKVAQNFFSNNKK